MLDEIVQPTFEMHLRTTDMLPGLWDFLTERDYFLNYPDLFGLYRRLTPYGQLTTDAIRLNSQARIYRLKVEKAQSHFGSEPKGGAALGWYLVKLDNYR
jgi:hypothetical protein